MKYEEKEAVKEHRKRLNSLKMCGKLDGACVHQNKESCDGCKLMELWLKYKDKSIIIEENI